MQAILSAGTREENAAPRRVAHARTGRVHCGFPAMALSAMAMAGGGQEQPRGMAPGAALP